MHTHSFDSYIIRILCFMNTGSSICRNLRFIQLQHVKTFVIFLLCLHFKFDTNIICLAKVSTNKNSTDDKAWNQVESKSRFTSNLQLAISNENLSHFRVHATANVRTHRDAENEKWDTHTLPAPSMSCSFMHKFKQIQIQMILSSILRNQIFSELMTLSLTIFALTSLLALHCCESVLFRCKSRLFRLLKYLSLLRTKKSKMQ